MTPKKEDYLKIIFELGGREKKVTNKQIAMSLNIAAGSVTEMVNKLVKEGLATHEPYAGISLTEEGVSVAERLVRRHRLWETFLVEKLNYKLQDVHSDAEVLEHVTSDNLMDHLEIFLDHPKYCPHGGVIPDKTGHYKEESHLTLADVAVGDEVVVDRFTDNHDLLTYLDDIDIKIGDRLQVLEQAPFEGPIKLRFQASGVEKSLGYKAAHYIFVK